MNNHDVANRLKRELRRLLRSMDLPRKKLKNFPVLLEYDQRNQFTGLTIFKPFPKK